jgi:hypothetical protein
MIVGIDLGTTNSAIGIWRDGRALLIPSSLGSVLTPSAVSVDDGGEFVIGLAARERQITHPTLTATSFKRFMGSNRSILLGARHTLRPEELSAMVLRSLKADAEVFLGEPVVEAVITVPAYFNDKQRKATRRAGELAGFKVERFRARPKICHVCDNDRGACRSMAFIHPAVCRPLGRAEHGSFIRRGTLRSDAVKSHDGSAGKNTIFHSLRPRVVRASIPVET